VVVQDTATPTSIPPATASPAAAVLPTDTPLPLPTQVALAPDPVPGSDPGTATLDQGSDGGAGNRGLLTLLSVGVGMAYIFFVLFVVVLAGLFVLVRRRQG
jgi:hypothetical protein